MSGSSHKKSFPSLLKKLWKNSVFPEHLVSGFRATGIHPLNRKVIAHGALNPSMPYTKGSYDRLTIATPITEKITSIFKEHFQAKLTKPASKSGRLQLNYYGESVISEKAVQRLRERERQRKTERRSEGMPNVT